MSCRECQKADAEGRVYWYRMGTANIGIIACEEHFREAREKLMRKD